MKNIKESEIDPTDLGYEQYEPETVCRPPYPIGNKQYKEYVEGWLSAADDFKESGRWPEIVDAEACETCYREAEKMLRENKREIRKPIRERRVSKRTKRPSREQQLWDAVMDHLISLGFASEKSKNVYAEDGYFFFYDPIDEETSTDKEFTLDVAGDMYHLEANHGRDLWEGETVDEFIVDFDELQNA